MEGWSGADSDGEEMKMEPPVLEVESIPLYYTRAIDCHNRSPAARSQQHTNVSENPSFFAVWGLFGRRFRLS